MMLAKGTYRDETHGCRMLHVNGIFYICPLLSFATRHVLLMAPASWHMCGARGTPIDCPAVSPRDPPIYKKLS